MDDLSEGSSGTSDEDVGAVVDRLGLLEEVFLVWGEDLGLEEIRGRLESWGNWGGLRRIV